MLIRRVVCSGLVFGASLFPALADDDANAPKSPASLFESLDKNGDGSLTKEEVGEQRERYFSRLIRLADADKDGVLTKEEFLKGSQPAERPEVPAQARGSRFGQAGGADREKFFQMLDTNGDGQITLDEAPDRAKPIVKKMLERAGKGEDGSLDIKMLQKMQRPGTAMGNQPPGGRGEGPALLKVLDSNKDGKLSKEEVAKIADRFSELDRNSDGQLDGRELLGFGMGRPNDMARRPNPGAGQPQGSDRFWTMMAERFDKNKDGKIAESEVPEQARERMLRADTNKDGEITKDEFLAAAKQRMSRDRRPETDGEKRRPRRPKTDN